MVLGSKFNADFDIRLQDYHLLWLSFPRHSANQNQTFRIYAQFEEKIPLPSYRNARTLTRHKFLAVPFSLTTTKGITFVFFSWPYLDVSVRAVIYHALCIQAWLYDVKPYRFPHSDTLGSMHDWLLPEA